MGRTGRWYIQLAIDAQKAEQERLCPGCGQPIEEGDDFWTFDNGIEVHWDCKAEYLMESAVWLLPAHLQSQLAELHITRATLEKNIPPPKSSTI